MQAKHIRSFPNPVFIEHFFQINPFWAQKSLPDFSAYRFSSIPEYRVSAIRNEKESYRQRFSVKRLLHSPDCFHSRSVRF